MKYLVIGLGIYGANLAIDLSNLGHEVVAVDINPIKVEEIKSYVSTVFVADTTEESSIQILPLNNIDMAIVAIGENFGASVKTVALLRKAGMRKIIARAIDPLHEAILEGLQIERVVRPEQRAAADLVHEMALGADVETLAIDDDNVIIKFKAPDSFLGVTYASLGLEKAHHLSLIAVTRLTEKSNILGIKQNVRQLYDFRSGDARVEAGDVLTVSGSKKAFRSFYASYS